jgi:hypothetical protein
MEQESIENTTEGTIDNLPTTIEENEENTSLNLGNSSPLLQQPTTTSVNVTIGTFCTKFAQASEVGIP